MTRLVRFCLYLLFFSCVLMGGAKASSEGITSGADVDLPIGASGVPFMWMGGDPSRFGYTLFGQDVTAPTAWVNSADGSASFGGSIKIGGQTLDEATVGVLVKIATAMQGCSAGYLKKNADGSFMCSSTPMNIVDLGWTTMGSWWPVVYYGGIPFSHELMYAYDLTKTDVFVCGVMFRTNCDHYSSEDGCIAVRYCKFE